MSFQIAKPALIPPRGQNLIKPVETLNMAMNLITRTVGDQLQSAVRLGELVTLGILAFDEAGDIVPGGKDVWMNTTKIYQNDFSSAAGTRAYFQSNVLNGPTNLSSVPNGTNAISLFSAFGGSDMTAAQNVQFGINTGVPAINVTKTGGVATPSVFLLQWDATEKFRFDSAGGFGAQGTIRSAATGMGYVGFNPGNAANPGYVAFFLADNTRVGYIGWQAATSQLQLKAEAGWTWSIEGGVKFITGTVEFAGTTKSTGAAAGVIFSDRTSARNWVWYGTGDVCRLYNGSADITTVSPAGAWVSASFTPCDERSKTVHGLVAPREDLAEHIELFDFTRDTGLEGRGPMAQAVQEYAPEYVLEVGERLAVDQVGLVTEALLGLAARVRRLESQHGSA